MKSKTTPVYNPDEIADEVKATMSMSGFTIPDEEMEVLHAVANGERSADDVRQEIYREITEWHASRRDDEDGNAERI